LLCADVEDVKPVDGATCKLELSGLIEDKCHR
jgi:hypothetical protein